MPIVYLIGGCSRSGKSKLAKLLLSRKNIPCFSTDVLDAAFREIGEIPTGPDPHGQSANSAVQRLIAPIIAQTVAAHAPYAFEGIHLSPEFVGGQIAHHPNRVAACVLGFPQTNPHAKLEQAAMVQNAEDDWLLNCPRSFQVQYLRHQQETSQQMQAQSKQLGLPFFDTGSGYQQTLEMAFQTLLNGSY